MADTVVARINGATVELEGNVLQKDERGTILLETRDRQHFMLTARQRTNWKKSDRPTPLYSRTELRAKLLEEYGPRFAIQQTNRYMIVHSCPPEFAREASKLFERAFFVFTNYFFRKGGFRFQNPEQPLIAVIFASREEYVRAMEAELGPAAANTLGVYSILKNRMFMYDNFGPQLRQLLQNGARFSKEGENLLWLLRGENMSTIIHEAVHQVAFNAGFHTRTTVQNPLWLVEGMAMYFESPTLDQSGNWTGAGEVNLTRLGHLRQFLTRLPEGSLNRLIVDDGYLRESETAANGYSEAWGFTYFLIRTKNVLYLKYLRIINDRPGGEYTPEDRLADFRTAFGVAPDEFHAEYLRYMQRLMAKVN